METFFEWACHAIFLPHGRTCMSAEGSRGGRLVKSPNNVCIGGYNGRQKKLRQLTESSANCSISLILFQIRFMLRANPLPPFSMLYKKEANSRDRKFHIEKGGRGSIVEIRKEICLKYPKMTKCLNTFVAHCSLKCV